MTPDILSETHAVVAASACAGYGVAYFAAKTLAWYHARKVQRRQAFELLRKSFTDAEPDIKSYARASLTQSQISNHTPKEA